MKDFIYRVGFFTSTHFDKLAMLALISYFEHVHNVEMSKEVFIALMVLIKGSGTITQK